ncbi:hypothetical protein D3C81_944630 [compost metagenome]
MELNLFRKDLPAARTASALFFSEPEVSITSTMSRSLRMVCALAATFRVLKPSTPISETGSEAVAETSMMTVPLSNVTPTGLRVGVESRNWSG